MNKRTSVSKDEILAYIVHVLKDFRKPRSICICDNPRSTEFDHMCFCKCGTCGQDISLQRAYEEDIQS